MQRRALLAFALLAPLAGAFAQSAPSPVSDPVATVRGFYAKGYDERKMPMSPRLARLFKAATDMSRKLNEPVTGLDFSWIIDGQDIDDNFRRTLKIALLSHEGERATVRATFRNNTQRTLDYRLVAAKGRWLVDEITSQGESGWVLSNLLTEGAKAP